MRGRHVLGPGERAYCALSWAEELATPEDAADAQSRIDATVRYWRGWLGRARIPDHLWRDPIQRSALAIKGLTYMPTGATVAALTTSLPETPGGERNWDYRYTWMRDTTFTLQALHYLNLEWEADEFMQFVAEIEPNEDGSLQIMYGIDGRRDLTEWTLDELSGYAGARPVRIGNGAFDQRQNDVYGAVLDSFLLHTRRSNRLPRALWPIVQKQAECATNVWKEPDQGIWEARGAPQHYVSSKLMCWVALDRAAKLAEIRGDPELQATWSATADEIHKDIVDHGISDRGVLRQHYATEALDASTLLAAIFGFLPPDDERLRKSVLAVAEELTQDGFVLRYRTEETDDGLSGEEGTFLICSFWLVSALAIVGEIGRLPPQVDEPVHGADHDRAADDVADRDREQVVGEEVRPGQAREVGLRVEARDEGVVRLDQERDRDEVHVRDRVLEAGRDERGDRRNDREDLVGRRVRAVGEPDGEADQGVAQHRERDRLDEPEARLRRSDRECRLPDGAVAEGVLLRRKEQDRGRERADEVADPDDRPVPEQSRRGDAAARPGHDDQVVPREELGARDDDEDQAEREHEPGKESHHAVRHRASAGGDGRREDRAERDERSGEHSEDEELEDGQTCFRYPDGLGLARDVGRGERVEPDRREGRLRHPGVLRGLPENPCRNGGRRALAAPIR